eukprot:7052675-Pyramimonas_sp.AAC.1
MEVSSDPMYEIEIRMWGSGSNLHDRLTTSLRIRQQVTASAVTTYSTPVLPATVSVAQVHQGLRPPDDEPCSVREGQTPGGRATFDELSCLQAFRLSGGV